MTTPLIILVTVGKTAVDEVGCVKHCMSNLQDKYPLQYVVISTLPPFKMFYCPLNIKISFPFPFLPSSSPYLSLPFLSFLSPLLSPIPPSPPPPNTHTPPPQFCFLHISIMTLTSLPTSVRSISLLHTQAHFSST